MARARSGRRSSSGCASRNATSSASRCSAARPMRARSAAITLTYTLDVEVADEARLLERLVGDRNITRAPDMTYRFVARAPAQGAMRPVVIGAGPCGLFAALVLAQMGFRPIILERGKVVRERTKDTWGLVAPVRARSGIQRAVRRGRRRPVLRRQAAQPDQGSAPPRPQGADRVRRGRRAGEILTLGKPHIGTFRLVTIVENMRRTIEALGGEYRFESRVEDLDIEVGRDGLRQSAASCSPTARTSRPIASCSPSATAPATRSRCCGGAASPWRRSRSPSACASSIRSR